MTVGWVIGAVVVAGLGLIFVLFRMEVGRLKRGRALAWVYRELRERPFDRHRLDELLAVMAAHLRETPDFRRRARNIKDPVQREKILRKAALAWLEHMEATLKNDLPHGRAGWSEGPRPWEGG